MIEGKTYHEEVVGKGTSRHLRVATVVPAVTRKCATCHGVKEGDLLGFLSYDLPVNERLWRPSVPGTFDGCHTPEREGDSPDERRRHALLTALTVFSRTIVNSRGSSRTPGANLCPASPCGSRRDGPARGRSRLEVGR